MLLVNVADMGNHINFDTEHISKMFTDNVFNLLSAIGNLAIHHPLVVTKALFNFFMVMFSHWQHWAKVRERSWSVLIQKVSSDLAHKILY